MSDIADMQGADRLLSALGEQLIPLGQSFELVVVGGSGLLALDLIEPSTASSRSCGPKTSPVISVVERDMGSRGRTVEPNVDNRKRSVVCSLSSPRSSLDRSR